MARVLIILNPSARGEQARELGETLAELSPDCVIRLTERMGDARRFAENAAAEGFSAVVAAGGDGTINEVVNGMVGSDLTLGLLPLGTMNVFATELGLPSNDLRKCWRIIEGGQTRLVDLPLANEQYFVQLAGIGLDAQVVQETTWDYKKNLGPLSYLISAAQIAMRKPPKLVVNSGGETREGSFVLLGNGRFYGGPFTIFKDAKIDDGKLDVLIFHNLGYLDIVRYLQGVIFGTHTNFADVEYFQTEQVTVTSEEEVPVEVDGEVMGNVPVTFRISPQKLKVFVPNPSP